MGAAAALAALVTGAVAPRVVDPATVARADGARATATRRADATTDDSGAARIRPARPGDPGERSAAPRGETDRPPAAPGPADGTTAPGARTGATGSVALIGPQPATPRAPQRPSAELAPRDRIAFARYSRDLAEAASRLDKPGRDAIGQILDEKGTLDNEMQHLQSQNDRMRERMEEAGVDPEPTAEQRADQGEVSFKVHDMAVRDQPLSPVAVAQLGLDDGQATAVEDLFRGAADDLRGELRDIFSELSDDPSTGDGYTLNALIDAIRDGSSPGDFDAAVRLIAQEMAGETAPPDGGGTGSAAERMLRAIFANESDRRRKLDELLGPELAEQLLDHPEMKGILHTYSSDGGAGQ